MSFDGLHVGLDNLARLSDAETRSISAENPTGEPGKGGMAELPTDPRTGAPAGPARELGRGWKVRPCVAIEPGETYTFADIEGPGAIQQVWITLMAEWRLTILRVYWDDQERPSVECPVGDFFALGWGKRERYTPVNSLAVCVNPGSAFNSYWPMPFRKRCRMTIENLASTRMVLFYQVNYALADVPEDAAYFHAQFRRTNPLPYGEPYTILDGVEGRGHYVGTSMAWGVNNNGWWGEGEIKFFLDDDREFPTICGTGTEDYFCGSYNFENIAKKQYQEYSTAYAGMPMVIRPDGLYESQQRFSLYRWHIPDPIRFRKRVRVTMQALGWRRDGRYLPLQDDIASVAYWYQTLPTAPFPALPSANALEII